MWYNYDFDINVVKLECWIWCNQRIHPNLGNYNSFGHSLPLCYMHVCVNHVYKSDSMYSYLGTQAPIHQKMMPSRNPLDKEGTSDFRGKMVKIKSWFRNLVQGKDSVHYRDH